MYQEPASNANGIGLVNFVIGQGAVQQGDFSKHSMGRRGQNIDHCSGNRSQYFEELGTMPLMSVPYALYAAKSDQAALAAGLEDLGAQTGQVLQWNGSAWAPSTAIGLQGDPGPAGPSGPRGQQVRRALKGLRVLPDQPDLRGRWGRKVSRGFKAIPVQPGAQGIPGLTGATGPAGATGPQGAQGTAGATGAQGPQGPAGQTGVTGPAGPD